MNETKGDGPYTHGNSFANGKPGVAADWQEQLLAATVTSIYQLP